MFYKIIAFFLIIHTFIFNFCSLNAFSNTISNITDLGLTAKSAVLIDGNTKTLIYSQNADEKLPPASVTKVMTLLLIYESIKSGKIDWDEIITVSEHAASMGGSQIFLEPLEKQTVRDLTKSIVIASANDSAVAMAERIGGSEDGFVNLMNERAKQLGMNNTNFVNACGLDTDGHVTTAYDIALMSCELIMNHPEITEYTTVWQDTIIHSTRNGDQEFGLTNTNKLIQLYDNATGLKTGSTSEALYCLSGTAKKDDLNLIGVVLAAPDPTTRFEEVIKLFEYGFGNFQVIKSLENNNIITSIPVLKGSLEAIDIVPNKTIDLLTLKGVSTEILPEYTVIPSIKAPFEKGTKVGELIYKVDGVEIGKVDLITKNEASKINLATMITKLLKLWCL